MIPPHFHTLTGNLLWEKTLSFAGWEPGRTQRAETESFQVGGKGINVSKMLARLGRPATTLCFPGGATGVECEAWLRAHGFPIHAFATSAPTRLGCVVRAPNRAETTFLGPDAPPDAGAVRALAGYLEAQPDGGGLAVCGSLPGWTGGAFDPLRAALARWQTRGILTADTYGPPLAWLVTQPLALVKINRVEFDGLFAVSERVDSVAERLRAALVRWPVQRWIVTDGPGAVWFAGAEAAEPASLLPPPVREVSATGSGDVLFACVLHALFAERRPLADAMAFALPCAAANAATPGIAEFPLAPETFRTRS